MVLFLFLIYLSFLFFALNCDAIKTVNSCKCDLEDGQVIDLSKLAKKDGSARFVDIHDGLGSDTFSYNPCKGFSQGSCSDVAVCQTRGTDNYNAGDQKGAVCFQDNTGISIVYTSDSPVMIQNVKRTTVLYLTCDSSTEGDLQVQGEITESTYLMTLTSKYACPFTPSLLSAGSILIIVLVCLLLTYFIGGILYQTFYKKAVGIERIPNYTLWTSLPSLVKEGSMFALTRVTGKGYSKI
ncbi:uncharacterized protein LOC143062468 [Mytilus galloprovincialis]|uniref:uncharacterized protein LOC143062468 n=1 Tax=Mytilus galloprovincialis TaxID=29158 RepID=UPI003F7B584C